MAFNFDQYLRSPTDIYISELGLPTADNYNNLTFTYSSLNLSTSDTYYIILSCAATFEAIEGQLFLQESESSNKVNFFSFEIPAISFSIAKRYNNYEDIIEDFNLEDYSIVKLNDYVEITDSTNVDYGNIYQRVEQVNGSALLIGNRYNFKGFSTLKTTEIEKVITIRGNKNYSILGLSFNKEYLGWNIQVYKVNELMGTNLPIPHTKINHLGIQGKAGMRYCINGNELRMTSRGIEEFFAYNENNPIFSIKVIPKNNFFLIDYEYQE